MEVGLDSPVSSIYPSGGDVHVYLYFWSDIRALLRITLSTASNENQEADPLQRDDDEVSPIPHRAMWSFYKYYDNGKVEKIRPFVIKGVV